MPLEAFDYQIKDILLDNEIQILTDPKIGIPTVTSSVINTTTITTQIGKILNHGDQLNKTTLIAYNHHQSKSFCMES